MGTINYKKSHDRTFVALFFPVLRHFYALYLVCSSNFVSQVTQKVKIIHPYTSIIKNFSACELAHMSMLMPLKFKVKVTLGGHNSILCSAYLWGHLCPVDAFLVMIVVIEKKHKKDNFTHKENFCFYFYDYA